MELCMDMLNKYSMILYDTTMVVTAGKLVRKNTKLMAD